MDRGSPQGNLTQLADGYALAAIKLIEDVLKDNKAKNADILIFPIMYSMDQMIELYLKAIICEVEVLSEGKANSYKTHDIKSLFDTMTAKIKKKEIKTTGLEKHLADVKSYIDELYSYIKEVDANGKPKLNIDFARYPFDTELEPYLQRGTAYDKKLRKIMEELRKASAPSEKDNVPPKTAETEKVLADDGTVYRYCTVRIEGSTRVYSYLTGQLPVKVDDWVEVPFGAKNVPCRGQVTSVFDCTRLTAPWPPEKTKAVLRVDVSDGAGPPSTTGS